MIVGADMGGHARRRTGNRGRPTKLLQPASLLGDIHRFVDWHDFMLFMPFLPLHHLVVWVVLLWEVLPLHRQREILHPLHMWQVGLGARIQPPPPSAAPPGLFPPQHRPGHPGLRQEIREHARLDARDGGK